MLTVKFVCSLRCFVATVAVCIDSGCLVWWHECPCSTKFAAQKFMIARIVSQCVEALSDLSSFAPHFSIHAFSHLHRCFFSA